MFITIKDLTFDAASIVAYGKVTLPETRQTEEFYATSIWLRGAHEPITVTYTDKDERDKEYDVISAGLQEAYKRLN